jgi:hypothetical protein
VQGAYPGSAIPRRRVRLADSARTLAAARVRGSRTAAAQRERYLPNSSVRGGRERQRNIIRGASGSSPFDSPDRCLWPSQGHALRTTSDSVARSTARASYGRERAKSGPNRVSGGEIRSRPREVCRSNARLSVWPKHPGAGYKAAIMSETDSVPRATGPQCAVLLLRHAHWTACLPNPPPVRRYSGLAGCSLSEINPSCRHPIRASHVRAGETQCACDLRAFELRNVIVPPRSRAWNDAGAPRMRMLRA